MTSLCFLGARGRGGPVGNFGDRGGFSDRIRDTGHNVHMRGLPFRAVERDIFEVYLFLNFKLFYAFKISLV